MKQYLLGIDIGTSGCKVAVFAKDGIVISSASEEYSVYHPKSGWAEQNPEDWWKAVCKALNKMWSKGKVSPKDIIGIGIDGQSWSAIAIDGNGGVLANTPIWLDTRASEICSKLNHMVGENKIFEIAGNSLQPSYTTAKILWFQKHMPEMYRHIYKILQSNSYIAYMLTGNITQDISQGYGLHCFNMRTGSWDSDRCKEFGFDEALLPDIYPCHQIIGKVHDRASGETGLYKGTPVVAGGLDAACGALGTGVINSGETQEQGGQAGGMSICCDTFHADPRLIVSCHVVPDRWLLQGGTTGGGGVMRWLEREFGDYEREEGILIGKSSLDRFNEKAANVQAGSDGLIFLPYMAGERSPIWDINAKGVFYGLDYRKTKGHFIRAAMEGVALSLKHNLEISTEVGAVVTELKATGGAANSILWTQIKSDVTGLPIIVPSSDTATALGAAILAGVGTGFYKSFDEAVRTTVRNRRIHVPNMEYKDIYQEAYEIYKDLYLNLKCIMNRGITV